jgi:hypothetical protein
LCADRRCPDDNSRSTRSPSDGDLELRLTEALRASTCYVHLMAHTSATAKRDDDVGSVGARRGERVAEAVRELVAAHRKLDDARITAALWLKTKKPGVWVLEVTPDMPADPKADQPMEFGPSKDFRFTLNLLLARAADFRAAMKRDPQFAEAVADAEPIPPQSPSTRALQKYARAHSRSSRERPPQRRARER